MFCFYSYCNVNFYQLRPFNFDRLRLTHVVSWGRDVRRPGLIHRQTSSKSYLSSVLNFVEVKRHAGLSGLLAPMTRRAKRFVLRPDAAMSRRGSITFPL